MESRVYHFVLSFLKMDYLNQICENSHFAFIFYYLIYYCHVIKKSDLEIFSCILVI